MGKANSPKVGWLSNYRERRADRRVRRAARRAQERDPAEIRRDMESRAGGFFSDPKR